MGPADSLWPSVAVADAYLAPRSFSVGPGGALQFRLIPSWRAAAITPPGPFAVSARFPRWVLPSPVCEKLGPRCCVVTRLARRSIPAARQVAFRPLVGFVRRHRAGILSFARLLSFMLLAPFMLGLSPTGTGRLPSGHGANSGSGGGAVPGGAGSCCFRPLTGLRRCLNPRRGPFPLPRPSHRTWGFPPSGVASRLSVKVYGAFVCETRCTTRPGSRRKDPTFHRFRRCST
jgi:hypothetical protein